jgi:hypothetical protein
LSVPFMCVGGRCLLCEGGKRKGADCQQCEYPEMFHGEMISFALILRMDITDEVKRRFNLK